ncbi:MAG TPA: hypothetical protein VIO36_13605 [Anaerolineaceae bacterium]
MSTSEERLKILKMVQEGKLSAEEAIKIIEALDTLPEKAGPLPVPPEPPAPPPATRSAPKYLHVRVTDTNTGKVRVNVRLPLTVISAGLKMGAKFSPEVQGLDMEQLMGFIKSGETGQVVDVLDEEDGEHVEVFVE